MPDDALQGSASLSAGDPAAELAMALLGAAHRRDEARMAHLLQPGTEIELLMAADAPLFGRGDDARLQLRSLITEHTSAACEIVAMDGPKGERRQEGLLVAQCADGRIARALLYLGPVTGAEAA
jgi:hypothetical protein